MGILGCRIVSCETGAAVDARCTSARSRVWFGGSFVPNAG
jgi:hypothetical protein